MGPSQASLFGGFPEPDDTDAARSVLDQLLQESRLYRQGKDFKGLLDFVVRLRNIGPFNAMLLQVQKPGLTYAASALDWWERFRRRIKEGARPLLILWPFAPVALVYDVVDTEGKALPDDVAKFFATGKIDAPRMAAFEKLLNHENIYWTMVDAGDGKAGQIEALRPPASDKKPTIYRMQINRNHTPTTQFATLAHELGHLFLGHLGADRKLRVPERIDLCHAQAELEAESVAYVVCWRNGVKPKSEAYLSNFVKQDTTVDDLDIYAIMHAAGQVETMLELAAHTRMPRRKRRPRSPHDL